MQTTVLSLLLLVTAAQPDASLLSEPVPAGVVEEGGADGYGSGVDNGGPGPGEPGGKCFQAYFGPEPQTCYAPRYGCYPGNNRCMHRYPAFHGYYYRHPYNYRNVFDYPWHAGPHEPTSHFSYNTEEEAQPGQDPNVEPAPDTYNAGAARPNSRRTGPRARLSALEGARGAAKTGRRQPVVNPNDAEDTDATTVRVGDSGEEPRPLPVARATTWPGRSGRRTQR